MYALAPEALPLLEPSLEILFWYGCETNCCFQLNVFCRLYTLTSEPSVDCGELPKLCGARCGEYSGWELVLVRFCTMREM